MNPQDPQFNAEPTLYERVVAKRKNYVNDTMKRVLGPEGHEAFNDLEEVFIGDPDKYAHHVTQDQLTALASHPDEEMSHFVRYHADVLPEHKAIHALMHPTCLDCKLERNSRR